MTTPIKSLRERVEDEADEDKPLGVMLAAWINLDDETRETAHCAMKEAPDDRAAFNIMVEALLKAESDRDLADGQVSRS